MSGAVLKHISDNDLSSAIQLESRTESNDQQYGGHGFGHGRELIMTTFVGKWVTYQTMGLPNTHQWNDMYYHGDGSGPTDCESCDMIFRLVSQDP